ncbi:MAG: hypothetical protein WA102_10635 [Candidatus Methanoperedens sp.]
MANSMSEDALFKALLKNRPPQQQIQKPPAAPQPAPKKETFKAAAPPAETYEMETPVETPHVKSHDTDQVVESIKNLTSSVNMMYGLIKTVITPVLVLILIIGVAILVRSR